MGQALSRPSGAGVHEFQDVTVVFFRDVTAAVFQAESVVIDVRMGPVCGARRHVWDRTSPLRRLARPHVDGTG
ncbi:hypothetical protein ACFP51_07685 [Streptomyces pratens]|uniref:Uncharacterized protein n=1 Tax=Streptomyces pratens TaxID=887456 RepID=A0ABW1M0B3_9ACTN